MLWTYYNKVGIDVIRATTLGSALCRITLVSSTEKRRNLNIYYKSCQNLCNLSLLNIFHLYIFQRNTVLRSDSFLTGKDVLVSVFAFVFWSHSFISALRYLSFQLLQRLQAEKQIYRSEIAQTVR